MPAIMFAGMDGVPAAGAAWVWPPIGAEAGAAAAMFGGADIGAAGAIVVAGGVLGGGGGGDDPHPMTTDTARLAVQHQTAPSCFEFGMAMRRFLNWVLKNRRRIELGRSGEKSFENENAPPRREFRGLRRPRSNLIMPIPWTFGKQFCIPEHSRTHCRTQLSGDKQASGFPLCSRLATFNDLAGEPGGVSPPDCL